MVDRGSFKIAAVGTDRSPAWGSVSLNSIISDRFGRQRELDSEAVANYSSK